MPNIIEDLRRIMNARYGRDVRQSIHDAISDINDVADHAESVAITSQESAQNNATKAESYAVGGTGSRTGEDTDNAKYYKEEAERLAGVYAVEDNLTSTSTIHSLSANQGRVLNGKITDIEDAVGNANGIATLDGTGRVPYSQLPESAMEFKGTWNANTNTPTLTAGVGDTGDFYVVSVGGTWHGMTFNPNDRIVFDGVTAHDWIKLVAGEVNSVNGMSGQVQLNSDDIPFDNTGSGIVADDVEGAIKELANTPNGHVVKDQGGTSLTQRPTMKFLDATPSDDSTNSITNIEVVKQVTASQLSSMPDGIYETTDESDGLISAEDVAYSQSQSVKQKIDSMTLTAFGTAIDVSGYSQADDTYYQFPSDGYIQVIANTNGDYAVVSVGNVVNGVYIYKVVQSVIRGSIHSSPVRDTFFVRKGMYYRTEATAGSPTVNFVPLE